jgi:hypothetical protein
MAYLNANEGVLNTEIEILADALDQEPEEFENYVGDEDDGTDLEQTEGWDGRPLGDEEQWETNINGHTDSGIDRPIALREGQAYEDALRQRDEQIAVLRQQNTAQAMALDPGYQQRSRMSPSAQPATTPNNGMATLISDGRCSSIQDHADRQYARRQLGLGTA